jgi:hypothetical protein
MISRTIDEYINYFYPHPEFPIKVWNPETEEFKEVSIQAGTGLLPDDCLIIRPIGKFDSEGSMLYQGDIVVVEIENKYGISTRVGVIRTEGSWFCGIEYFNKEGRITEEGDFIDEFYIINIKKVIHVLEAQARGTFDWEAYLEE